MKTITLNNLQIHSNTSDLGYVIFLPILGLESPEIRFSPYNKAGEHGAIVPNELYGGRTITLSGRISGRSPSLYLQNKRTFESTIRTILDSLNIAVPMLLKFTTLDNLNLQCYVFKPKKPEITDKSLEYGTFMLELFAPDINFYDQSVQIFTLSIPTGGGVVYPVIYPVSYPAKTGGNLTVVNNGNNDTFPKITFNGPLTSPFITNITLGETFQINKTLISGDSLVVDMANKTMVLNGNQNASEYFVLTNSYISLQPHVLPDGTISADNLISIGSALSSDTGNILGEFRNAYIGT